MHLNIKDMYDAVFSSLKEELQDRNVIIGNNFKIISDWKSAEINKASD